MKQFLVFVSVTEGINENAHTVWKSLRNTYEGLGMIEAESEQEITHNLHEGRYQIFEVTNKRTVDVTKETRYHVAITPKIANDIYDILKDDCGASEDMRGMFIQYITLKNQPISMSEFRFQGHLGFGGKFYASSWGRWRTDCYEEDKDSVRRAMIDRANRRLAKLWMKCQSS